MELRDDDTDGKRYFGFLIMRGKMKFELLFLLRNALHRTPSLLPRCCLFLGFDKWNHGNELWISGLTFLGANQPVCSFHSLADPQNFNGFDNAEKEQSAIDVHSILKNHRESSIEEIERILDKCLIGLTQGLVLNVLHRNHSDWKPAYTLFKLILKQGVSLSGSSVYNEILDVLGKMRRFEEVGQVLDEMLKRKGLADENTYGVLLNRYAAAHRVDEAVGLYKRRNYFGIDNDLVAFRRLLMWLCRYKHVEVAETLFCSTRNEFGSDIKTMNIILNGWCVLGNVHEAKRFWKDIIASKCRPDVFTFGTFINALTKKGKLGKAMELFRVMWDTGRNPDVKICNNIIDALCFKKRILEALELFKDMSEKGCSPNVATYNSLLKHLCKIRRMEKVYELLDEMEQKGGECLPNDVTFNYLLKCSKKPQDVEVVLERMARNKCEMTSNLYNLIFRLYMEWDCQERVREIWNEMMESGLGPDQRTYTIRVHALHKTGRIAEGMRYYQEMLSKGMLPEPRTEILVNEMRIKMKEGKGSN